MKTAEEFLIQKEGFIGVNLNDGKVRLSRPQIIKAMDEYAEYMVGYKDLDIALCEELLEHLQIQNEQLQLLIQERDGEIKELKSSIKELLPLAESELDRIIKSGSSHQEFIKEDHECIKDARKLINIQKPK